MEIGTFWGAVVHIIFLNNCLAIVRNVRDSTKEYISHVAGTATSHRLQLEGLTQPLPACSVGSYTDGQAVQYTADRAGRGWVSQMFVRR